MRKEAYFSEATIEAAAAAMLEICLPYRSRHQNQVLDPAQAALLVLDMQPYFLREGSHAFIPSGQAVLPGIRRLIEAFSASGRPVIFTKHTNTAENAGMMRAWWKDLLRAELPDSRIDPRLNTAAGVVLDKGQYDAFYCTELEDLLLQSGSTQVVVSGVMAHLCCETTARSAFVRGFEVFFAIDGTAAYTRELHQAALLNLSHGFAVPMLVGEILAALDN